MSNGVVANGGGWVGSNRFVRKFCDFCDPSFFRNDILRSFPNCGYRNMRGHLRARGLLIQWNRIKDSMRRVCPEGILSRSLQLTAVHRRTYSVRSPLSLWHIDGNHKLIRLSFKLSKRSKV